MPRQYNRMLILRTLPKISAIPAVEEETGEGLPIPGCLILDTAPAPRTARKPVCLMGKAETTGWVIPSAGPLMRKSMRSGWSWVGVRIAERKLSLMTGVPPFGLAFRTELETVFFAAPEREVFRRVRPLPGRGQCTFSERSETIKAYGRSGRTLSRQFGGSSILRQIHTESLLAPPVKV